MNTKDTIIAPATAAGEGGIAIIRISGPAALQSLKKYFKPSSLKNDYISHRLYHGMLVDQNHHPIDEVMAVFMAGPKSYTCDDVVEIHSHGSQQIIKSILNLYQHEGLRLAEAGEFTYRAFVNGRIDLSQAEAVSRLIKSNSDSSRRLALSQVDGELSRSISQFSATVKHCLVLTEAWIDFPEEDLPDEDLYNLNKYIAETNDCIGQIVDTFDYGRIQMEGASIMLVGEPNVGKSSLLNTLLGEDRAIVTDIPGTTRDLLEEGFFIDGLPVRVIDSAGLRLTDDPVEKEGIRRAEKRMAEADLVLLLVDSANLATSVKSYAFGKCSGLPTFLVSTKQDINGDKCDLSMSPFPVYPISVKSGEGIEKLKKSISSFLLGDSGRSGNSILLTERRHYDALLRARNNLKQFLNIINLGGSLDLLAFELRDALYHLGQISGETTTEDILDDIFSGFCIGK